MTIQAGHNTGKHDAPARSEVRAEFFEKNRNLCLGIGANVRQPRVYS